VAIVRLSTTDPFLNLAHEASLLDRAQELGPTLLLWKNDPCVVIGRHQNPWLECDLGRMKADAVPLVRRTSGGGAVYHDGGNTNFSFVASSTATTEQPGYDQERHFRVVIAALRSLGITAWKSDRNDLRVGDRKISGNAFRHTRGRSLHHGTLLVHADLDLLTAYLTPRASLIETKATASVRSAVTNLGEHRPGLTHEELWDAVETAFAAEYGPRCGERLDLAARSGGAGARAAELASWEWVYGHSPAFVRRMTIMGHGAAAGTADGTAYGARRVEVAVTVRKGRIVSVESPVGSIGEVMVGLRYEREEIERATLGRSDAAIVRAIARSIDS
jgi:lipoate---protein ligase